MKGLNSVEQSKAADETNQSEIMISVQVRNEDVINTVTPHFHIQYLNLSALTAVK
jgi:head-tail adaptor